MPKFDVIIIETRRYRATAEAPDIIAAEKWAKLNAIKEDLDQTDEDDRVNIWPNRHPCAAAADYTLDGLGNELCPNPLS